MREVDREGRYWLPQERPALNWKLAQQALAEHAADLTEAGELQEAWETYKTLLHMAANINDGLSGLQGAAVSYDVEQGAYGDLLPWAMHADNTEALVLEAARWVDDFRREQPPWSQMLLREYRETTARIDGILLKASDEDAFHITFARQLARWELTRARRMRDYLVKKKYEKAQPARKHSIPSILRRLGPNGSQR